MPAELFTFPSPADRALPPVPPPPMVGTDPRQANFIRISANIGAQLGATNLVTINVSRGFFAANVNVGVVQSALAAPLVGMNITAVKKRWAAELHDWMLTLLETWVQRLKTIKLVVRPNGIRVEFTTQDDHGYYAYGFDVFPGIMRKPRQAPREIPPS